MSFVADIFGSILQKDAADGANYNQRLAADKADATQRYFFDQTRTDNQPLLDTRNEALGGLRNLLSNPNAVTKDPGYQFGMSEGTKAIDRSAAGKGGLYSGATLKALTRYGSDFAGTKLDQSYNRLSNVAGLGQVATSSNTQAGVNAGNNISANQIGVGNALAGASLYNGANMSNAIGSVGRGVYNYGQKSGWWVTPTVPQPGDVNFMGPV